MQRIVKLSIFILALTVLGGIYQPAMATLDLSYVIDEGGYRIELDRNNFSRAATFTATNDTLNNRYEVRQRIESPLRNRDNPTLTIGENFVVRAFRGSNRYGDLRLPSGDIAVKNDELVYLSDPAGSSDSFILAYGVTNSQELAPGYYTGRISLVMNPINSSVLPVTRVIEVYVTIPDDGGSLSVTVAPAEGVGSVIIDPSDANNLRGASSALVTVNSTFSGPFRIMQMLPSPIQSSEGKFIDNRQLLFSIPDASVGVGVNQPAPVSGSMQTIYSSRPDGSADKVFTIAYSLADPLGLTAGNYRCRIQYLLESSGKQINLGALDLEIRQERIFEITISPQDQRYSIDFDDLKPGEGPRLNEVLMEVRSNLGRPYQVAQNVISDLTSSQGKSILSKYFLMRTLPVNNTKGNLKAPEKTPVEKGSALLFVSDTQGSSDKFKVIYELNCPEDLTAGNYASRITYTLTEI